MSVALDQEAVNFLKSIGAPDTYKNVNLLVALIIRKQAEVVAEQDALRGRDDEDEDEDFVVDHYDSIEEEDYL